MFLEFDFVGGPFYKKYPNFDFWLSSPGVRRIKKLQETRLSVNQI